MNFFTFSSRAIVAIAQQNPATWFKLCEIAPFVTEDIEWWHKDTLKSAYTQVTKDGHKTIRHYLNTSLHRNGDLPAVEKANGHKSWYISGKLHRDNDLPAMENAYGDKEWFISGERHRDNDLPAVERACSTKIWFISGQTHRDNDLPAVECADGTKFWYKNGVKYNPNI
jgi:hypothetical protein